MAGCIPGLTICSCNLWLSGLTCYSKTFRLSFYPVSRPDFRDEASFRLRSSFPEGKSTGFRSLVAETICFLRPWDFVVERTFPVFVDLPFIRDWLITRFPLSGLQLSWCADPKVWPNRIVFHLSNLFRFHIFWAAFYRSSDRSNVLKEY